MKRRVLTLSLALAMSAAATLPALALPLERDGVRLRIVKVLKKLFGVRTNSDSDIVIPPIP